MTRHPRCIARRSARPRQTGIALILVLWVLTLLTVMAVGLTATQRTETALAEGHVSAAQFRAVSDAAIAFTMLVYSIPPPEPSTTSAPAPATADTDLTTWVPNGNEVPWRFGGMDLRIRVLNEGSLIDLNTATPEVLAALLAALGVDEEDSLRLAAAIADWRDDNDLSLLNGAEDADYEDVGRTLGAKDEPFVAVEELMQVMGMTDAIYQRLSREVSVDLDGAEFDNRFATAAAIAATEGLTLERAQAQIIARDSPLFDDGSAPRVIDRGGPLYRIEVSEVLASGVGRRMDALVESTPGEAPPYRIRWRRFGIPEAPPVVVDPDAV
jgi:general secretion pathway protein K